MYFTIYSTQGYQDEADSTSGSMRVAIKLNALHSTLKMISPQSGNETGSSRPHGSCDENKIKRKTAFCI